MNFSGELLQSNVPLDWSLLALIASVLIYGTTSDWSINSDFLYLAALNEE